VTVSVRRAEPADLDRLREVAFAAKAHWGYDPDIVRRWADGLTLGPASERWVAEVDGAVVAWAALIPPEEGVCVLDDLWVEPEWIGQGIGRRLFEVAAGRARELGASSLGWEAEPNAVGFYEKVGGSHVCERVSEWGRVVPWMGLEL
jgi:N-acetylglutamate synthase-like GNAT family acetyltransferase